MRELYTNPLSVSHLIETDTSPEEMPFDLTTFGTSAKYFSHIWQGLKYQFGRDAEQSGQARVVAPGRFNVEAHNRGQH